MIVPVDELPNKIYLEDYGGNYSQYIDKVYQVFKHDFIDNKPHVEDLVFKLKFNPMYQDNAYTFYHMT